MKLIKLKDKFILVSDEKTLSQNGDFYLGYPNYDTVHQWKMEGMHKEKSVWINKIIAGIERKPSVDFSLLSEEDCKKIGWVDELSLAEVNTEKHHYAFGQQSEFYQLGFIEGFKTAQSLNDEKLIGNEQGSLDNFLLNSVLYTQEERELIMDAISNWLQQTEWDVEIEMETINQDYRFDVGQITKPKITNNSVKIIKIK